jgi:hypothetical protein
MAKMTPEKWWSMPWKLNCVLKSEQRNFKLTSSSTTEKRAVVGRKHGTRSDYGCEDD